MGIGGDEMGSVWGCVCGYVGEVCVCGGEVAFVGGEVGCVGVRWG